MCIFLLFACQKNKQICTALISIDSLANINADSAANVLLLQISPVQSNFTHEEEAFYNLLQTKINITLKTLLPTRLSILQLTIMRRQGTLLS